MLVAAAENGRVVPVLERRQDLPAVRLGARTMATLIEAEAALAREFGADSVTVALAPELKGSHLARGLRQRLSLAGLGPVVEFSPAERGRISFGGITAATAAGGEPAGEVALVEIEESATNFAVGRAGERPRWWASRPLLPRRLLGSVLRGDPPGAREFEVGLSMARRHLATLKPPRCESACIAGPDAGLLALACGERIDRESLRRAERLVGDRLSEIVAAQLEIEPAAARRLPALLVIARAAAELLGQPLLVARGGLPEGLVLSGAESEVGSHEPA